MKSIPPLRSAFGFGEHAGKHAPMQNTGFKPVKELQDRETLWKDVTIKFILIQFFRCVNPFPDRFFGDSYGIRTRVVRRDSPAPNRSAKEPYGDAYGIRTHVSGLRVRLSFH